MTLLRLRRFFGATPHSLWVAALVSFSFALRGYSAPAYPDKLGDLNGDGLVDITDLVTIINHINATPRLDNELSVFADVNQDGVVNNVDAEMVVDTILVLGRLAAESAAAGKTAQFAELKAFLPGDEGSGSYPEVAARLGLTEGAVRVAVHRMRQRYGELFRAEIAHTVASAREIDEEINHLLAVLSG